MLPKKLQKKLDERTANNSLRKLGAVTNLIDFSSNDYLGFSKNKTIFKRTAEILNTENLKLNGATGSRLLSGNHQLYEQAEQQIAKFHNTESALVFNSGYVANLGFFSSVPQRGDLIFYDELCHASIRDGIKMSDAKSYKFRHNNLKDLTSRCHVERPPAERAGSRNLHETFEIYVVTESVFSMDGDQPDLKLLTDFCTQNGFHLIIDEAHALGVFGNNGEGLVQELGLEQEVFARLVTFGKALGCHGAAILGSKALQEYLINFARSFLYTTALSPHTVATIISGYEELSKTPEKVRLQSNIEMFQNEIAARQLESHFIESNSAIISCIIPGNDRVKHISEILKKKGFDVKPILSPTVPKGQERLRICLHSYNKHEDISHLIKQLHSLLKKDV
ncbi:MAG: 8-amino-7-oxononanoate synthase [Flavobacteriaceae bacterium]|nr:8-amino-7-oxononanoate synthase [Flavobacteriaceae bacterium]